MEKHDTIGTTSEFSACNPGRFSRRIFFRLSASALAGLAAASPLVSQEKVDDHKPAAQAPPPPIKTNVEEAIKIPRGPKSMPGKYPGKVIKVGTGNASAEGRLDPGKVKDAVERGMAELTGEQDMKKAWLQVVSPSDVVGIKVNPIGGSLLSTRPEVVDIIIAGLLQAGVPRSNIIIWDRRHFQLLEAGFTPERFPGIQVLGTELKGPNNEFFDEKGDLWSKDNIDREALPYFAEVEQKYDKETLPYMINEGKNSYFSKIVTQKCTKIINVPVLKNAGPTVTLCLKNVSYGSLSNTGRLHKLWLNSVTEPCAFPPLRDKVVLNIADGLRACYDGGPGANPKFIYDANVMFFGTDPVAVDTVAHDFIVKERMKRGVQQLDDKKRRAFLDLGEKLGLGVSDAAKIRVKEINLG